MAVGWRNEESFLSSNAITNSDMVFQDLERANLLFGKAREIAAGKMTAPPKLKNTSNQVLLHDLGPSVNRRIKLYVDILFVNGDPYLHTKSKDLNYVTISRLNSCKVRNIKKKLKRVIIRYLSRGFIITDVFGDNEFQTDTYEDLFAPATLHICSKGEHVPRIERSIRTIKERARAASTHLPFNRVPKLMTVSLLEGVERWLNVFPREGCKYSPTLFVDRRQNPRGDIKRIAYGSYALVYVGTKNNLDSHTVPAIAKPWRHDEPFTLSYIQEGSDLPMIDGGEVVTVDESDDEDAPAPEQAEQLEGQQGGDDAQQIEEHAEEVLGLVEETDTDDEGTEDTMEPNEYSGGTTLEAYDSTYTSDSTYTPEVQLQMKILWMISYKKMKIIHK